jgi:hypothetical protein
MDRRFDIYLQRNMTEASKNNQIAQIPQSIVVSVLGIAVIYSGYNPSSAAIKTWNRQITKGMGWVLGVPLIVYAIRAYFLDAPLPTIEYALSETNELNVNGEQKIKQIMDIIEDSIFHVIHDTKRQFSTPPSA